MKDQHYDPFDKKNIRAQEEEQKPELDQEVAEEEVLEEANEGAQAPKEVTEFVTAGFWSRGVALLIDLLVAWGFSRIFASPIVALLGWPSGLVAQAIKGFFFYLYFVLSTKLTNGQTLGKMVLGLRVIQKEEQELSWATVIVREFFGRIILQTVPLVYLMAAIMPKKTHLVDLLVETHVVKEDVYRVEQDQPQVFKAYL